jgi:glycosyltransferase involved in cell wall biosynthesis
MSSTPTPEKVSQSISATISDTISVALCTYNGARFLEQQLASLEAQERRPDELVVCDDRSTDKTVPLLESFAGTASFPVRIHINPVNLGSTMNFDRAMRLCAGTLIAFCDQDDVWRPTHLSACARALQDDPGLGLVFSNGQLIDDTGAQLPGCLWDQFTFHSVIRERMRQGDMLPLVRYRFVTGATLMFRAQLREHICPAAGEWLHDGWLAAIVACMARVGSIDQPLIDYRIHHQQQVGTGSGPRRKPFGELVREHWLGADWHRQEIELLLDCIRDIPSALRTAAADDFARQHAFLTMRTTLPGSRSRRLSKIASFRADYQRRASGWKSMLMDLLLPKRNDETGSAAAGHFSALGPR